MIDFLLSPFTFYLPLFLYIASEFFTHRVWKKGFRICSIIVLTVIILTWMNSFNAKVTDGAIGWHALLVGTITHHVEELIEDHKYQEAESFIKEFNTYYHKSFHSSEELEKFIEKRNIKIYSPIAEEAKKRLDALENEMRSEPSPSH